MVMSRLLFAANGDIFIGQSNINGESKELVYNNYGSKNSELTWRLDDVKLLNIQTNAQVYNKIILGFNFSKNMTVYKSIMDDYDWINNAQWTDWSNHPDTTVKKVLRYDLYLKYKLEEIEVELFDFYLQSGYRYDQLQWEAKGGRYIYSRNGGFRNYIGNFPSDNIGISYGQDYTSVYMKLDAVYSKQNFIIKNSILYSPSVVARDHDLHHNRGLYEKTNGYGKEQKGLYFEGIFDTGQLFEYKLDISYSIATHLDLTAYYFLTYYDIGKGYNKVTDVDTQDLRYTPLDSAAISHKSSTTGFAIKYIFDV
ncbi:Protease VII (Omptin) precursor [hydrothermal vent metagenome]|uniref:Protease VII (Omptin) n=1 Tax=hydrothermal vent metagenome TaxID=652676 RepID=A0A3B1E088_9ZZZZ